MGEGRKLGRTSSHRLALLSNLATELLRHGQIITTLPKAKELRSYTERLLTKAKKGGLSNRRLVMRKIKDKRVVNKIFQDYAVLFQNRPGGYTRIIHLGHRSGDRARMAMVKLVDEPYTREAENV